MLNPASHTAAANGYDIIGDVHGKADKLFALLRALGYQESAGVYQHPYRKAIFVGDLIDNGNQTLAVLTTVKAMVDGGHALITMGNHELNAVGWATMHSVTGEYLREHSPTNQAHHQAFLDDLPTIEERRPWLEWFKTLPLFLDLGEFRVIHACWHEPSFAIIKPYLNPDNSLRADAWETIFTEGSAPFQAVENLLKGVEEALPEGVSFLDHKGKERWEVRISWWLTEAETLADIAHIPMPQQNRPAIDALGRVAADNDVLQRLAYTGECPVFFGHYWLAGTPQILTEKTACVDYSAARKGPLVAYRWSGEQRLRNENFVAAGAD